MLWRSSLIAGQENEIAAIKIAAIKIASVAALLRNNSFFQTEQAMRCGVLARMQG
jgi:hypothetical protein